MAGGKPCTDPSVCADLALTAATKTIYAWRRPRWRRGVTKRSPEKRRRRATAAARFGLRETGEPEGKGRGEDAQKDRELTLILRVCSSVKREGCNGGE